MFHWCGYPVSSDISENCRADELARAGALLPDFSSIELVMPIALVRTFLSNTLKAVASVLNSVHASRP